MININQLPSQNCPEVIFDNESKSLNISGNSYPENCEKIYEPIKSFIEQYAESDNEKLKLSFQFNLINSTSIVYIAQIVVRVPKLVEAGIEISVEWYYDEHDDELLDLGEKLSSISKLPFEYIAVKDED